MSEAALDFSLLEYQPLSDDCLRGAFACGEDEVDSWFKKKSDKAHGDYECRITTVHYPGVEAPIAFYALAFIAERESLLQNFEKSKSYFPALHIEWLAVDKRYQRQGLGQILMGRIIAVFIDAIMHSGLPALTLVALNEKVEKYYEDLGFKRYGLKELGGGRRMLLPRQSALEL